MRKTLGALKDEIDIYIAGYKGVYNGCNERGFGIGCKIFLMILATPMFMFITLRYYACRIILRLKLQCDLITWKLRQNRRSL